jgi:hypothetical protein
LLALPAIGAFFVADLMGFGMAWHGATTLANGVPFDLGRQDATARLFILAAALAGFAIAYLTILRFVSDMNDEFGPKMRLWLWSWLIGGVTLGGMWVLRSYHVQGLLGDHFLLDAVNAFGKPTGAGGDALFRNFESVSWWLRLATMLASGMVVTGGVSCLAMPIERPGPAAMRAYLHRQHRRLRSYVNLAAIVLVLGIVFQVAWMRWPALLLSPMDRPSDLAYVDAAAIHMGVTGSVVIALFAVPTASVLTSRGAELPPAAGDTADDGLFDKGLLDAMGKVLIVLAPALAGVVPTIVQALGGGGVG